MLRLVLRRSCCKLETAVYAIGIILTTLYLVVGLGGVVWFVLCHMEDSDVMTKLKELYLLKMETMMDSLAVMGALLVITFMGLLTCLLLILGVRTEQRLLLLPWQLYHFGVILACFAGGLYQILHFTVLSDGKDSFQAAFSLFPIVGGLFFIFIWVLVHQLAIRLRYRRQLDRVIEEKRASLASLHHSLPRQYPPVTPETTHRSVRSIRTLKRRGGRGGRSHSVEHILTESEAGMGESPYYWVAGTSGHRSQDWSAGRSRSLPRHLDRGGYNTRDLEEREDRDYNFDSVKQRQWRTLERTSRSRSRPLETEVITIPKCSTEKMKRRQINRLGDEGARTETLSRRNMNQSSATLRKSSHDLDTSQSVVSVKNVTIHPEVTQFSYNHHKPSSKVWREINSTVNNSQPGSKLQVNVSSDFDKMLNNGNSNNKWLSSDDNDDDHRDDTVNDNNVRVVTTQDHNHKVISVGPPTATLNNNGRDLNYLALSDTDTVDCYTVPSPIYPATSSSSSHYPSSTLPLPGQTNMKRRTREQMTRHQIINMYSTNSDDRER